MDGFDVCPLVHPRQLLYGGQRRIVLLQVGQQAGSDQLIRDRAEPCRTFRMAGTHVVQQAIRMADVGGLQLSVPDSCAKVSL